GARGHLARLDRQSLVAAVAGLRGRKHAAGRLHRLVSTRDDAEASGGQAGRGLLSRAAQSRRHMGHVRIRLAAALAAGVLAGCGARHAAPPPRGGTPLASVLVEPEQVPAERLFDGVVQAVNRATMVSQTSGRVAAVYRDVGDVVPAGALLLRLRATMQ
ncbi:hypothetical protein B2A_04028, partial [mine drainage metagenome]